MGGHEGVGNVVKLGAGAENSSVKVGDRVGIKWVSGTCGSCREFFLPSFLGPLRGRCKGREKCVLVDGWDGF